MKLSSLAKKFKALANEQRILLLMLLKEWEGRESCCPGVRKGFTKACDQLNISRSTISHHFKALENAGLIKCVRNGQAIECQVNEEALQEMREFLS